MTEKEKATELYNKMWRKFPADSAIHFDSKQFVKDCALVAVDETLSILEQLRQDFYHNPYSRDIINQQILYYINIKREIEKL
jgi:hypothetical protein